MIVAILIALDSLLAASLLAGWRSKWQYPRWLLVYLSACYINAGSVNLLAIAARLVGVDNALQWVALIAALVLLVVGLLASGGEARKYAELRRLRA